MSLAELGYEHALTVPESPEFLAATHPELSSFLNELDRPIGLIKPEQAAACVLAPEITPDMTMLRDQLGQAAHLPTADQIRAYGFKVTSGFTEFGDRLFSIMGPRHSRQPNYHLVENIAFVEGRFLFGHQHLFKINVRRELVERAVEPLTQVGLDRFTLIGRRALQMLHN